MEQILSSAAGRDLHTCNLVPPLLAARCEPSRTSWGSTGRPARWLPCSRKVTAHPASCLWSGFCGEPKNVQGAAAWRPQPSARPPACPPAGAPDRLHELARCEQPDVEEEAQKALVNLAQRCEPCGPLPLRQRRGSLVCRLAVLRGSGWLLMCSSGWKPSGWRGPALHNNPSIFQ